MLDFIDITKSWAKRINPSKEELELANKRIKVCNTCEHRKVLINFGQPIFKCELCTCPIKSLVYTEAKTCPKGFWEDE